MKHLAPDSGSSTVDKAVRVLRALHGYEGPVGLAQIAGDLDIPKATAHRLLATLLRHDLVETDGEGRYCLGMGLVGLGLGALTRSPVGHVARPELERAAIELGQTFFLVAARAGRLWILERAEGNAMLRAVPSLGAEVPVAPTASGRLYLAYARDLVAAAAPAPSARKLWQRVEQVRSRGYDLNDGEWIDGLRVIAAPILAGDSMHGCVACAGARESLDGQAGRRAVRFTREVASRIAQRLGSGTGQRRTA